MNLDAIGKDIVHGAIKVHKALGPGLLESVYQKCLAYELEQLGHTVQCELPLPIQKDARGRGRRKEKFFSFAGGSAKEKASSLWLSEYPLVSYA